MPRAGYNRASDPGLTLNRAGHNRSIKIPKIRVRALSDGPYPGLIGPSLTGPNFRFGSGRRRLTGRTGPIWPSLDRTYKFIDIC